MKRLQLMQKKIIARPLAIKTLKRCIKLFLPFTSVKKVHVLSTIPGKVFGTKYRNPVK